MAPPLLNIALCASQPRLPRREPVHPHCSRRLHGHHAHACAPVIALAHLPLASLLCSAAASHNGWRHHCSPSRCVPHCRDPHGESQCIPTAHAVSMGTTLTHMPCDCAGALATRITPLQCGCCAQRLAPPLLTIVLCASLPRPPRREPVHPHCSRRLHGHHAHARAPVIALAHLPRASLLCSVAAAHNGWRHHSSRSCCVPHCRDPHGESQCIPTAHAASTGTTLTRVPL